MEEKVLRTIVQFSMFGQQNNVIVALSGGADSMALFHFLHTHASDLGLTVAAAHFEHGLRGEESLADAETVKALCAALGAQLTLGHGRMSEAKRPGGVGIEEWARQLRYAFFEKLATENKVVIALGHTRSDNSETVLFNAIRGTGTKGLAGIPPVRGPFCRPLLEVTRAEVEAYCHAHRLPFVVDSTNEDNSFSRNRIRNKVMPQLELAHPGAEASLVRLASDMRQLDSWLQELANEVMAQARASIPLPAGDAAYSAAPLLAAPLPVRQKALGLMIGPRADRAAMEKLEAVARGQLAAVTLPGGVEARLAAGRVVLRAQAEPLPPPKYELPLIPGRHPLPGGYVMDVEIVETEADGEINKKSDLKGLTFVADYDKMINCGIIRVRRTGDVFAPEGRQLHKTVKKWMNEQQIDARLRQWLPLVAHGSEVLWIWGAGFCSGLRPHAGTGRILVITTNEAEVEGQDG